MIYVTSMVVYELDTNEDTNSYHLPECHYNRYENITKSYMHNVYARIMILYCSIRLVYAFVSTHSLRCVNCDIIGSLTYRCLVFR